jgi:hypothetical protein
MRTVLKTKRYIVRKISAESGWTVEEKDGHNVIGNVVYRKANPPYHKAGWAFVAYFNTFTRSEFLGLTEVLKEVQKVEPKIM